jgi:hypothetical protein
MGLIHSKIRNSLGAEKVRDTAVLKTELQREHTRAGLSRKRLRKRKFGDMNDLELNVSATGLGADENLVAEAEDNDNGADADADPTHSADDTTNNPTNFTRLANGLIDAAKEDDEANDDNDEMETSFFAPHHRLICYFRRQELIPLAKLFHFQLDSSDNETPSGRKGKDLDYYWKGAIKNLDKELELYKLLQDVETMREDEAGQHGTPIEVE